MIIRGSLPVTAIRIITILLFGWASLIAIFLLFDEQKNDNLYMAISKSSNQSNKVSGDTLLSINNDNNNNHHLQKATINASLNGFYKKSISIPIPSLMVAGPPKTGTTTFAFTLNRYRDIWKRNGEPRFWVHANSTPESTVCAPHWTESQWTQFIEQYERSEVTLSSLQSAIPSVCNADGFRKKYEMELTERPPERCRNPFSLLNGGQSTSDLPECWLIEKTPHYSWRPFISILVSNLLPKTRYLTILRDPAPHVWSNYFHFGGGSAEKMQLS